MLALRQRLFDHAKESPTDALKTSSKNVIQKTAETTGDLFGNKVANAVAKKYEKCLQKNARNY